MSDFEIFIYTGLIDHFFWPFFFCILRTKALYLFTVQHMAPLVCKWLVGRKTFLIKKYLQHFRYDKPASQHNSERG